MRKNIITLFPVLLLYLSLIALTSCSAKKSDKDLRNIDIAGALGKGRIIPLSEIAKDIRYIPLETNDSSLVGKIYSLVYENGLIYVVQSSGTISIFDENGKFVRKIDRQGNGPQEYLGIPPLDMLEIDKNNGNLIVLSLDSKIYEYTKIGAFVRRVQPPESVPSFFNRTLKIQDNLYISSFTLDKDTTAYCAVVYDSLSQIKKMIHKPSVNEDLKKINVSTSNGFMQIGTHYLFTRVEDKIMIYSDKPTIISSLDMDLNLDTAFTINYGPYMLTPSNIQDMGSPDAKIINWIGYLKESKDYVYLWLNLRALAHEPWEQVVKGPTGEDITRVNCISYGIFNKNTGEVTLMNRPLKEQIGFKEDFENGPAFWPKTVSSQEYLVVSYDALTLKDFVENNECSNKLKEVAAGIGESDNPIVALVKLK